MNANIKKSLCVVLCGFIGLICDGFLNTHGSLGLILAIASATYFVLEKWYMFDEGVAGSLKYQGDKLIEFAWDNSPDWKHIVLFALFIQNDGQTLQYFEEKTFDFVLVLEEELLK